MFIVFIFFSIFIGGFIFILLIDEDFRKNFLGSFKNSYKKKYEKLLLKEQIKRIKNGLFKFKVYSGTGIYSHLYIYFEDLDEVHLGTFYIDNDENIRENSIIINSKAYRSSSIYTDNNPIINNIIKNQSVLRRQKKEEKQLQEDTFYKEKIKDFLEK